MKKLRLWRSSGISAGFATTLAKFKYSIAPRRHSTEAEAAGFGEAIRSVWQMVGALMSSAPAAVLSCVNQAAQHGQVHVRFRHHSRVLEGRAAPGCATPIRFPLRARCRRASTTTGGVFRAIPDNSGKLGQLSELRTTTNPQARTHRRREARSRHPRSPGHYHWRPSSSLGPIEKSVRFRPGIYLRQTRR